MKLIHSQPKQTVKKKKISNCFVICIWKRRISYLNDDQETDSSTHFRGVPVHARHDIYNSLPNGNDHTKYWQKLGRKVVHAYSQSWESHKESAPQTLSDLEKAQQLSECSHFWAPLKSALSLGVSPTSMILAPANNCMIKPDVTIGEIPSSIKVPVKERERSP